MGTTSALKTKAPIASYGTVQMRTMKIGDYNLSNREHITEGCDTTSTPCCAVERRAYIIAKYSELR